MGSWWKVGWEVDEKLARSWWEVGGKLMRSWLGS